MIEYFMDFNIYYQRKNTIQIVIIQNPVILLSLSEEII